MILASATWLTVTLTVVAALAYVLPAVAVARLSPANARRAMGVAWLVHGLLLAEGLLGTAPRFGFAPALSMTAWLVAAVYAIESRLYPQLQTRWAFSALGAVAVVLAALFPGQPQHPSASVWLPLHWALGLACYGLFAAAAAHAWLMNRTEDRIRQAAEPHSGLPLLTIERLTFRFVTAGFVLLTATLVVGWWFGESLYGAAGTRWKWDHKTIFSLLSWLTFAVLLIGRARLGWRGRRAARILYIGSALLLLAYVGSRFVIEVILGRSA